MVANTKVVYIGETQANALLEEQKVMESEMEVKPKEANKEKKEKKEKVVKAKTTKAKKINYPVIATLSPFISYICTILILCPGVIL